MHIPGHFLSGHADAVTAIVAAGALGYSLKRVKDEVRQKDHAMPLLAAMAAFVFAAQMLNFPIGGGTSGHFLGAAAVAALLGPWSACVVLSFVLAVQAFFFGDGGIATLGANILNMGVIGGILAYPLMRKIRALFPGGRAGYIASAAIASWASIVAASAACALELAASGTSPLAVAVPAMVGTHAMIGIGEALITAIALSLVTAALPELVPAWARLGVTATTARNARKLGAAAFALAALLALFASPLASTAPDGLEKVAMDSGFAQVSSPNNQ